MPIIDLQRQMTEVGRIRMGHQVPYQKNGETKYRAAKLEHFRITGRDQSRLTAIAELYGGKVVPWEERAGEFEVFTTTAELPIIILPGQTLSQWWELWSGGGCQRRCDGVREILSDEPCVCDAEGRKTRQCKPTTRLSVMLPDVPGLGVWRLESHGYYAAVELAGTAALLEAATVRGQLLPARLRIDQRSKVEGGKTTRYAVPVIDVDITARAALLPGTPPLELAAGEPQPSFTPVAETRGVTVGDGLDAVAREAAPKTGNGRQAAAIGPAPDADMFSSDPIPVQTDEPIGASSDDEPEFASGAQTKLLWTTVRTNDLPEPRLREILVEVTAQSSSKKIPRGDFETVLRQVEDAIDEHAAAQIPTLVKLLEGFGEERGNVELVRSAIERNRAGHGDRDHAAWMRAQIVRAQESVAA